MHEERLFPQDELSGLVGQTLLGIKELASMAGYREFRAAVAYASFNGCRILENELRRYPGWRRSRKRWLISIDYGRTEPESLRVLAKLANTEVRIPNGRSVLARVGFIPQRPFHPKTYTVDDIGDGAGTVLGVFVGSGNLTGSGLLTGSECGVLSYWSDPNRTQRVSMLQAYRRTAWFETAWQHADPLADVAPGYEKLWKKSKPPIVEEDGKVVDLYLGGADRVVAGNIAVALASANALWVEVNELYKNRGRAEAGNQVDMPRGCRVFFGLPATAVPRDTMLGHVFLQNVGFEPAECSIRFANNQMDKVNLPVPGVNGPASYDNSILRFERAGRSVNGMPVFEVSTGTATLLQNWKKAAQSEVEWKMQSGRRYGVLF